MSYKGLKEYPEILVREKKVKKDRKDKRDIKDSKFLKNDKVSAKTNKKKDYVKVELNVGRSNKFNILEFIRFATNNLGIRKSNIGDIEIKDNYTILEITKGALPFLLHLEGNTLFNKKIRIKKK